jgi:septal ring factor EnvC (AmiA/AmiB activator)
MAGVRETHEEIRQATKEIRYTNQPTESRQLMTSSYIKMQLKQIRATLDNAETDIELLQQENKRLLKQIAELTKEMESVNE